MNQAEAGAALLDKKNRGWFKRIKRPVRIESYTDCTLSQVYGELDVGAKKLGLSGDDLVLYGFHTKQLGNRNQANKLSRLWQYEIDVRITKAARKKEPVAVTA